MSPEKYVVSRISLQFRLASVTKPLTRRFGREFRKSRKVAAPEQRSSNRRGAGFPPVATSETGLCPADPMAGRAGGAEENRTRSAGRAPSRSLPSDPAGGILTRHVRSYPHPLC